MRTDRPPATAYKKLSLLLFIPVFHDRPGFGHHLVVVDLSRASDGLLYRAGGLSLPADQPFTVPRVHGVLATLQLPPDLLRRPHGRPVHDPHLCHTHHTHEDNFDCQNEDLQVRYVTPARVRVRAPYVRIDGQNCSLSSRLVLIRNELLSRKLGTNINWGRITYVD